MSQLDLRVVAFTDPQAQQLVSELHTDQLTRYPRADPPEENPADYQAPDGLFVLLLVDGRAVGCGGYRRHDATTGEIKRMYLHPAYRGHGYGRRILHRLEAHGRASGASTVILETGIRNIAAIGLYRSAGYQAIPSYAHSRDRRINRAYAKTLHPETEASWPPCVPAVMSPADPCRNPEPAQT